MSRDNKAADFRNLHCKGAPFVLYNSWDAGSSLQIAQAGAAAVGTGSWSVAAAQGYPDGEAIPFDLLLTIVARICATASLPVTADFEGGFAESPEELQKTTHKILETGIVGINFEDQKIHQAGLFSISVQAERIAAVRAAAVADKAPLFINARTDLFLQASEDKHQGLAVEAIERAAAYAVAGADGFFVPGLKDPQLIAQLCEATDLPVNVMMLDGLASIDVLAELGVARISYGPAPYRKTMEWLATEASKALTSHA